MMEQSGRECTTRRTDLFPSSRAMAGDKGVGTVAHGHGSVNRGRGQTVGGGGGAVRWSGHAHGLRA
jgi:hypothetical protein